MSGASTVTRASADGASQATNPLRDGLESNRITDPCNVVIFGASGDLANRMLFPAIYNLRLEDILPSGFGLVGFARTPETDDSFRTNVKESIDQYSRSGPAKDPLWSDFAKRLSYVTGDFDDPNCYRALRKQLSIVTTLLGFHR